MIQVSVGRSIDQEGGFQKLLYTELLPDHERDANKDET